MARQKIRVTAARQHRHDRACDHGKTTLTAAITKTLSLSGRCAALDHADITTRLKSARGIVPPARGIRNRHAPLRPRGPPGPRRLHQEHDIHSGRRRWMAILVVSAPDGPMPQTRAHLVGAPGGSAGHAVVF